MQGLYHAAMVRYSGNSIRVEQYPRVCLSRHIVHSGLPPLSDAYSLREFLLNSLRWSFCNKAHY
jgi:hypothetical protein